LYKGENKLTLPNSDNNRTADSANTPSSGLITDRQYVRIFYPQDCPKKYLPVLTIRYHTYPIIDISEAGLCFHTPRLNLLHEDILKGSIKFTDDSIVEFSGVVVRRTTDQIALKLIIGIPYTYIASEQVRLRNLETAGEITISKK
jgi:hypothetical protein